MAPRAWTGKDERQYEHIKEQERKGGRSMKRSKEIAARTVNKQRAKQGRVKEEPMLDKTKGELMKQAKRMEIKGRSKMSKSQLVKAIRAQS